MTDYNKSALIDKVATDTGQPKAKVQAVLDAFQDTVGDALAEGGSVRLSGLGNFETVHKSAGKARNPQTGEQVDVPARQVPKFKPAKALKERVNGG